MTVHELHWELPGREVVVRVEHSKGIGTFHIAGQAIPFRLLDRNTIEILARRVRFYAIRDGDSYTVWLDGHTYHLKRAGKSRLSGTTSLTSAANEIKALMPGKLLRLEVAVGDVVSEKQIVALMESMKMETALHASNAGMVKELLVSPGAHVEAKDLLAIIE